MKPIGDEQFGGGELWPPGREQMVQDGDVARIWREIRDARWGLIDLQDGLRRLSHAIEAESRNDPAQFAAEQMSQLVAITADISYRAKLQFFAVMSDHDRRVAQHGPDTSITREKKRKNDRAEQRQRHRENAARHDNGVKLSAVSGRNGSMETGR